MVVGVPRASVSDLVRLRRYVRNATLLKAIFDDLADPPSLAELSDRGAWLAWSEKHQQAVARPAAQPAPQETEASDLEAAHEALLALTAQAKAASDAQEVRCRVPLFASL